MKDKRNNGALDTEMGLEAPAPLSGRVLRMPPTEGNPVVSEGTAQTERPPSRSPPPLKQVIQSRKGISDLLWRGVISPSREKFLP